MWIPDRGREGRGQVPATSPAHGAQRSRKGRRRRPGRILPKLYFIGTIRRRPLLSLGFGLNQREFGLSGLYFRGLQLV